MTPRPDCRHAAVRLVTTTKGAEVVARFLVCIDCGKTVPAAPPLRLLRGGRSS